MIDKLKFSKFWRLSLGLLLLGIGQRLVYTGAVSSWARDRGVSAVLLVLNLVFLGLGLALVLPLMFWFYKCHRSDKRLSKLVLLYLLGAALSGLIIGGLGQLLYDHTSLNYYAVRTGIWTMATIVQSIFKVVLCFGLVSIHKHLPLRQRKNHLWLPLIGVILVSSCSVLLYYWWPTVGSILVSLIDAIVLVSTLYYWMYLVKEEAHETTS